MLYEVLAREMVVQDECFSSSHNISLPAGKKKNKVEEKDKEPIPAVL